ncbi:MAG: hypothetical protein WCV91_05115 [Candidatus Margulisiibacteriota bacterium]
MKIFTSLMIFCCTIAIFYGNAFAETPEQSIDAIRSSAIAGNAGVLYSYLSLSSIAANETKHAYSKIEKKPVVGKMTAKIMRKTASTAISKFLSGQLYVLLKYNKGSRAAAARSFKVNKISVKGKTAIVSASYRVPGATEGIGLTMDQNNKGLWVITSINSKLLRRAVNRFLLN